MTTANDKVLDHTRLQLSALFDGELALDEARFLERRLQHDDELAGCVSSWQLAGDILRGQATAAAPAGFAAQVAAALAAEARQAAPATAARRSRSRWGSGAALAASVAAIALFMARQSPEALPVDTAAQIEIASAAPARPTPVPQAPAPDTAAQLAAATVAVAEVPRRVAARRAASSRGQAQRAATTRASRTLDVAAQPQLAVASAAPGAIAATAINPFMPDATAASTSGQRPWPRALLPNAGAAFNVGYGNLQPTAAPADPAAHPFRPRPVRVQQAPVAESIPTTP